MVLKVATDKGRWVWDSVPRAPVASSTRASSRPLLRVSSAENADPSVSSAEGDVLLLLLVVGQRGVRLGDLGEELRVLRVGGLRRLQRRRARPGRSHGADQADRPAEDHGEQEGHDGDGAAQRPCHCRHVVSVAHAFGAFLRRDPHANGDETRSPGASRGQRSGPAGPPRHACRSRVRRPGLEARHDRNGSAGDSKCDGRTTSSRPCHPCHPCRRPPWRRPQQRRPPSRACRPRGPRW